MIEMAIIRSKMTRGAVKVLKFNRNDQKRSTLKIPLKARPGRSAGRLTTLIFRTINLRYNLDEYSKELKSASHILNEAFR